MDFQIPSPTPNNTVRVFTHCNPTQNPLQSCLYFYDMNTEIPQRFPPVGWIPGRVWYFDQFYCPSGWVGGVGGFENPFELYYNCITSCWMILIKQLAFSRISLWRHFYHDIQHCVRLTKIFFLQFRIIRSYCLSSVVQKIDRKWHGIKINKPSVWLQILSKTAEEIEPVTCQYKYTIWFTSLDCDGFYTHINCRYQYY